MVEAADPAHARSRTGGSLNGNDSTDGTAQENRPTVEEPFGGGTTTFQNERSTSVKVTSVANRNFAAAGGQKEANEKLLQYEFDEDERDDRPQKRASSVSAMKTEKVLQTNWFDTNEEFEKHHKKMKKSLRQSGKIDPENEGDTKLLKSLKNMSSGMMFLGGTDAYDITSRSDMAEMMLSLGPEEGDDLETIKHKETMRQRYFSKIGHGSLRGSILGMTSAAIGSGVLTFPNVFKQIGWVNGSVLMILGAFGCWWSLYMLIQRARHHNCFNYSQIAEKAGGKCLARTLQISILMYMYATCLACTIILTQLFVAVMNAFGVPEDVTGKPDEGITLFKVVQAVVTGVLLGWLSLGREMSSFKNLAVLSVIALSFTIFLVCVELPFFISVYKSEYNCLNQLPTCYSAQFFNGAGIVLFAFTNQCNVLPVYSELQNPVKRRLMTIIRRSIILVLCLYLVMSLSGYFATLNNTPEVVLLRSPPIPDWSTDWLMNVASILVMTTMVTNIVLNYMPFRNSLYFMFTGREDFSQKFNLIATACFQAATASVSIVFPQVSNVLAIFGGIASVNIVYIVPLTIYFKLKREDDPYTSPKNLAAIIYFSIMCLIGWGSSLGTILMIFGPKDSSLLYCQKYQEVCPKTIP